MNAHTRDVVGEFLDEVAKIHFAVDAVAEPLHVVERRLLLAQMVLAEVDADDLEALALRATADAVVDLCWAVTMDGIRDAVERFIAARRAHLEVTRAGYDSQ